MSEIVKRAMAGTLESSDVLIELEPNPAGLEIQINSVVQAQYEADIRRSVMEILQEQGVKNVRLTITDRGALDCIIRARVETALLRGKGE